METEIDRIKKMPIEDFLARLGYHPVQRRANAVWYRSPYREEKTPSFKVNPEKNLWYDFGEGKGGNIFALAGEFIRSDDFLTQVKYVAEMSGMPLPEHEPRQSPGVRQAGGQSFEDVEPKDVTLLPSGSTVCNVHEGFMDYLSARALGIGNGEDHLVLNSVSNAAKAFRYLDGYGRINCYLDNDEAGRRTLEALGTRYGERVSDCSGIYGGCKDLNEHLQKTLAERLTQHENEKKSKSIKM